MKQIKTYLLSLAACILSLITIVLMVSFSDNRNVPSWSDIFHLFSGQEEEITDEDYIKFIDVGQGDSILISSNGYNCMIDFGNQSDFSSELLYNLKRYGVKELDCMVITHYDSDHAGGAAKVVEAMNVYYALLPEQDDTSKNDFYDLQYSIGNNVTEVVTPKTGTVINIGDFEITVLAYNKNSNDNDSSIILMAQIDSKKFLLTGDAGAGVEKQLIADGIDVDCDVFKVAHHGSRNSNCQEFVSAASPEYAVISCGASNQYGHPHEEVLETLEKANSKVYRTDRSGDITFYIENSSIRAETEY